MRALLAAAIVGAAMFVAGVTAAPQAATDPSKCNIDNLAACDQDGDGTISVIDLAIPAQFIGMTVPTSTAVPTATPASTPSALSVIISDNTLANDGCVTGTAGYDWAAGPAHRTWNPQGTHLAAWAMVEWECQHDVGAMVELEVRDFRLYGLVNGAWQLITAGIYGSQINDPWFGPNIYGSAGSGPLFTSPPHDRAIQFYQAFVAIPSGLTGVYATYRARLTAPSDAYLMLNVGADWASFPFHDYGDMGVSRLKRITTSWQQYAMTTLSESSLRANPPP